MPRTTLTERRKAIWRDVIKQVESGRFKPTPGVYVQPTSALKGVTIDAELAEVLEGKKCEVCAKGALMVARLDKKDELKVGSLACNYFSHESRLHVYNTDTISYLSKEFTADQLASIEAAFEQDATFASYASVEEAEKAEAFGRKHRGAKQRLLAIARNALRHKGVFTP